MRNFTYDANLQLSDEGAITASAAAQVASAAKVIDVGLNCLFKGVAVVDVTAVKISSTDELYRLTIQGSNSPTFASGIQNLASLELGATAVRAGGAADSLVGRYELIFQNEQADVLYQYIRLYRTLSGSTPSITGKAFVSRDFLAA